MMICWSPYQERITAYQPTRYLLSHAVKKAAGGTQDFEKRSPAPELLMGHPVLFQRALAALPFKKKYRVATLSCAAEDVDTNAFNIGEDHARRQAAGAIQVFIEAAFAGVPTDCRPPVLVGTHTHTGRLELNVAMPRCVWSGTGAIRSFNPHPPVKGSTNFWDAVRDLINHHFGWQSPLTAQKTIQIRGPDWLEKEYANAIRLGIEITPDTSRHLYILAQAKSIVARNDNISEAKLVDALGDLIPSMKVDVVDTAARPERKPPDRSYTTLRLVPPLGQEQPEPTGPEALARLKKLYQTRAEQNASTFGFDSRSYELPDWQDILDRPTLPLPRCHPENAIRPEDHGFRPAGLRLTHHLKTLAQSLTDALARLPILTAFSTLDLRPMRNLRNRMEPLTNALSDLHRPTDDRSHLAPARRSHKLADKPRHQPGFRSASGNDSHQGSDGDSSRPLAPDPAQSASTGGDPVATERTSNTVAFHETGYRIDLTGAECPRLSRGQLIGKMKQAYGKDCRLIWTAEGVYCFAYHGAGFRIGLSGAVDVTNSGSEPLLSALSLILPLVAAPQPTFDCDFTL